MNRVTITHTLLRFIIIIISSLPLYREVVNPVIKSSLTSHPGWSTLHFHLHSSVCVHVDTDSPLYVPCLISALFVCEHLNVCFYSTCVCSTIVHAHMHAHQAITSQAQVYFTSLSIVCVYTSVIFVHFWFNETNIHNVKACTPESWENSAPSEGNITQLPKTRIIHTYCLQMDV